MYNACEILGGLTKDNHKCSFFQEFEYTLDLFIAYSSILIIRFYLNLTIDCLDNFLSRAALIDKNKLLYRFLYNAGIILKRLGQRLIANFFMNILICLIR